MRLRDILKRRSRLAPRPLVSDWTTTWTTRDWADLPTYHPRSKTGAPR